MNEGKEKKCPKCGKLFCCCDEHDCWCEKYTILKKEMYVLMNTYHDCLCEECLKGYTAE